MITLLGKKRKVKQLTKSYLKSKPANESTEQNMEMENERSLSAENRNIVINYIGVEKKKEVSDQAITVEYTEKVVLYGYLIVRERQNPETTIKNNYLFIFDLVIRVFVHAGSVGARVHEHGRHENGRIAALVVVATTRGTESPRRGRLGRHHTVPKSRGHREQCVHHCFHIQLVVYGPRGQTRKPSLVHNRIRGLSSNLFFVF